MILDVVGSLHQKTCASLLILCSLCTNAGSLRSSRLCFHISASTVKSVSFYLVELDYNINCRYPQLKLLHFKEKFVYGGRDCQLKIIMLQIAKIVLKACIKNYIAVLEWGCLASPISNWVPRTVPRCCFIAIRNSNQCTFRDGLSPSRNQGGFLLLFLRLCGGSQEHSLWGQVCKSQLWLHHHQGLLSLRADIHQISVW